MMNEEPRLSARELMERLDPSLSRRTRVRAVVALVAGLAGTVFIAALWGSEPGPLPGRTQVAFGLFTAFCMAWTCYGGWLLKHRVPLFATERVIAAWVAVAASTTTTALVATIAAQRGTGLALPLVVGLVFVAAALTLAVRAHAHRGALLRRVRELTGEKE